MVDLNSTFAEVSLLDKAALYAPHVLYSTSIRPELISYSLMIAMATFLVASGSYSTLSQPKTAKDPIYNKNSELWDPTDRDGSALFISLVDAALNLNMDVIDVKLAMAFPVLGAGALYGLDYLLRLLDFQKIRLLNYYMLVMVFLSTCITLTYFLTTILRNVGYSLGLKNNLGYFFNRYRLTLSTDDKLPLGFIEKLQPKKMDMTKAELKQFEEYMLEKNNVKIIKPTKVETRTQRTSLVLDAKFFVVAPFSLGLMALLYWHNPTLRDAYGFKKINWIVNNLVASTFAFSGSSLTRIGNFKVGVLMLVGLFVYDVYFVFGSTLMVSVASNLELPVKLVIPGAPKDLLSLSEIAGVPVSLLSVRASILGLGDIVVPSIFASLCLRFDHFKYYERTGQTFHRLRCIGTPKYFVAAMLSYIGALVVTVLANHYSGHGQPALLYIVPSMILGVFGEAAWNGEASKVWNFSEELDPYTKSDEMTPKVPHLSESGAPDAAESLQIVICQVYEFGDIEDESDDTYIIEEDTEDDEDYDSEDLSNEIDYLLRDQEQ